MRGGRPVADRRTSYATLDLRNQDRRTQSCASFRARQVRAKRRVRPGQLLSVRGQRRKSAGQYAIDQRVFDAPGDFEADERRVLSLAFQGRPVDDPMRRGIEDADVRWMSDRQRDAVDAE